jgi:glycosyltransferase involved in cell wall biosynthesis
MSAATPRVGVFVPCHNEAAIISETIRTLRAYLSSDQFPYEGVIIVVDDGSRDDTFEQARAAGADVLYRHETNRGLGAATRAGMEIAHYIGCDAFAKFDADLQHDVNDIAAAVRPLIDNEADVIYASRFAGKIHYKMPFIRAAGNRVFTLLMRLVTGWHITDAQTGLMCFSRRYLSVFEMPASYNPPQQALFDASRKGMRYAEVPAQFYARKTGTSFVSLKYIEKVISSLLKIAFYHYCFKAFTSLGLGLLLLGFAFAARGIYGYLFEGAVSYLPHGTLVLFSVTAGLLAVLFGLQSYALLGRQPYIRNTSNYFYIVLENITVTRAALVGERRLEHPVSSRS